MKKKISAFTLALAMVLTVLTALFISGCNSAALTSKNNPTSATDKAQLNANPESKAGSIITSNNLADLIEIPDKIIYYHQGKENIIQKGDVKFDNIIKMSKSRVGKVDMYKEMIIAPDKEALKQTNDGVEFVYSKDIEVNFKPYVDNAFQYKFVYNSLFFDLTGSYQNKLIFWPIKSGPLGPLKSGDELLKYLNN